MMRKVLKRMLHLQEWQSKHLMNTHKINTQKFIVASSEVEAKDKLLKGGLNGPFVVKAQILAGGRGKGVFINDSKLNGVRLVDEVDEASNLVGRMVGDRLVTIQTGESGSMVGSVMVAEAKDLVQECYFAIIVDRSVDGGCVMVASPRGGMDIEQVAKDDPSQILKIPIDQANGPTNEQICDLINFLKLPFTIHSEALEQIQKCWEMFVKSDALQVEVNPFGVTSDGELLCFDAKIEIDDNAQFRSLLFENKNSSDSFLSSASGGGEDPLEIEAKKIGLNYIGLDGNIGCLVNGAGLAMATLDLLKLHDGQPANFLDIGGNAQPSQVSAALSLLSQQKCIFINVFGGIVRCDLVAKGIVESGISVPIVVRMVGSREKEGREILKNYGGKIEIVDDLDEAAKVAVRLAATNTSTRAHVQETIIE